MSPAEHSRLEQLEAEARYRRERAELYRARTLGPRPTSLDKLRQLERVAQAAQERLEHARREAAAG